MKFLRILCIFLTFCLDTEFGLAQEPAPLAAQTYVLWEKLATRAETAIDKNKVEKETLERLLGEIVQYRDLFAEAAKLNEPRIKTLNEQLAALGPAPTDGTTEESEDTKNKRAALLETLKTLRQPIRQAEEASIRAEGLIKELDALINARIAETLFERRHSLFEIDPADRQKLFKDLTRFGNRLFDELAQLFSSPVRLTEVFQKIIVNLLILFGNAAFFIPIYVLATRYAEGIDPLGSSRRRAKVIFLSIVRFAMVFYLLYLLLDIATAFDGIAERTALFVAFITKTILIIYAALWLIKNLCFALVENVDNAGAIYKRGKPWAILLSFVYVTYHALYDLFDLESFDDFTLDMAFLPVFLFFGIALWQLAKLFKWRGRLNKTEDLHAAVEETASVKIGDRLVDLVTIVMRVVAIATPLSGLIGFYDMAEFFFEGSSATLVIVSLAIILQRFVTFFVVGYLFRDDQKLNGLTPTLIALVIVLGCSPIMLISWGVSPIKLQLLWSSFLSGFQIGDTHISPIDFLLFAIIFVLGYSLTRFSQFILNSSILPKTSLDTGSRNAITSGVGYLGIFLSAMIAISWTGLDLSSLAIVAGALSVGIGFGLQNIVQNFVSGIILLIERPVSQGDWVEVNGKMGYVRDISVRSTRIETFDRTDVIVPNADFISGTVTNWTRGNNIGRVIVSVGVAYGSDTRKVGDLLLDIAQQDARTMSNPAPSVVFQGFGTDALLFEIRAFLYDVNTMMQVKSEMNHEIARIFAQENIAIPFAQRDLWLRNPEVLRETMRTTEN